MCDCVELIKKNREKIVAEAIRSEIIRGLVSKIKDQDIEVPSDGSISVEYRFEVDEKVTRIAYNVVDEVIKLLEGKNHGI